MSLVHVIIERSANPTPENQASAARALALRYQLPEADALKLLQAGQRFRVRANADPADAAKMVSELTALGLIAVAVPASGRANTPLPPGAPQGSPAAAAPPPRPPAPPPMPARPAPPAMPAAPAKPAMPAAPVMPAQPVARPAAPPAVAKTMMGGMSAPPPGLPALGGAKPAPAPAAAPPPAAPRATFESGLGAAGASAPPPPTQTFGLAAAAASAPTASRPSPAAIAPPAPPPPTATAESSFDKLGDAGGLMLSALDGSGDEKEAGGPVDHIAGRSQAELEAMFRPPDEQEEQNQLLLDDIPAAGGTVNAAPMPREASGPSLPSGPSQTSRAATPTATLGPSTMAADLASFGIEVPTSGTPGQKKRSIALDLSAITGALREHATGPLPLFAIGIALALLLGYLPVAGYASGAEEKKFAPVVAEITDLQAGKLTLSEWKELPTARRQATERMGNARTRIAVMSVLLWGAIAGGLAFAWTRFLIPPLVERWSRPPGV